MAVRRTPNATRMSPGKVVFSERLIFQALAVMALPLDSCSVPRSSCTAVRATPARIKKIPAPITTYAFMPGRLASPVLLTPGMLDDVAYGARGRREAIRQLA